MPKKPRSDSKLDALPPHQREQLVRWLTEENISYEAARDRVHDDFGVKTSIGAISKFFATKCFSLSYDAARHFADGIVAQLSDSEEKFDAATLALIRQKAFERAAVKGGDIDELATLAGILGDAAKIRLKEREVALADRRVALLEKKAALADAAKEVAGDATLTAEQREQKMRALFSIG